MQIALLVLKILGIVLLILLGIVLALVLLVLFVPIRYRLRLEKKPEEDFLAEFKLGWLARILYAKIEYKASFRYIVRIAGIPVMRGDDQEEEEATEASEDVPVDGKSRFGFGREKSKEATLTLEGQDATDSSLQASESDAREPSAENGQDASQEEKENSSKACYQDAEGIEVASNEASLQSDSPGEMETSSGGKERKKRFSIGRTLREWYSRIMGKIKSVFYKVKVLWQNVREGRINITEKIGQSLEIWNSQESCEGRRLLLSVSKSLLKHIWPKKIKGRLLFGMSDPASTGKILAVLSVLYGFVESMPEIVPDFEEEILDLEFTCKGRIRIAYIAWIAFGVWRSEDFNKAKEKVEEFRRLW